MKSDSRKKAASVLTQDSTPEAPRLRTQLHTPAVFAFAWLLGLSLLATPMAFFDFRGAIPPDLFKAFLAQSGVPLILVIILGFKKPTIPLNAMVALGALVVFEFTISLLWAFNLSLALIALSRFVSAFLILVCALELLKTRKTIQTMLWGLLASVTLVSWIGIAQRNPDWFPFHDFSFWVNRLIPQAAPPASTFGNRNMAMHVVVLLLPIAVWSVFQSPWRRTFPFFVSFTSLLLYLTYSQNRTSYFSILLEFALGVLSVLFIAFLRRNDLGFLLFLRAKWKEGLIKVVALGLLASAVGYLGKDDILAAKSRLLDDTLNASREADLDSITHRLRLYEVTGRYMIPDHWLTGVGVGNWTVYYPYYMGRYRLMAQMAVHDENARTLYKQTHNEYLQLVSEQGLLGTIPVLGFFAVLLGSFALLYRRASNFTSLGLTIALASAFIGIGMNASSSFPFRVSGPLMILGVYAAIVYTLARGVAVLRPSTGRLKRLLFSTSEFDLGPRGRVSLGGLLIGLSVLMGYFNLKWTMASIHRNYGAEISQESNILSARNELEESLQWVPSDPYDAGYTLGSVYMVMGDYDRAIAAFRDVFKHALPWHPYAKKSLVLAYLYKGDIESAKQALKSAIIETPLQIGFYEMLGNLYIKTGRVELGIQYLERASSLAPEKLLASGGPNVVSRMLAMRSVIAGYRADHPKTSDELASDLAQVPTGEFAPRMGSSLL